VIAFCLLTGCQPQHPPAPPLPVPTTLFSQSYFSGSALSGPVREAVQPISNLTALCVHVTFIALEKSPSTNFQPVGSRAVFFSATGGGDAVLPAAELTRGAVIADLHDPADLPAALRAGGAGRTILMSAMTAALPAGVTAQFAALDPATINDLVTGEPTRRSITIQVSRPTDPAASPQIALVLRDLVTKQPDHLSLQTEKALFNPPAGAQTNTAFVIPFHFDDAQSKCVAVLVQISPGNNDPAHMAATTQAAAQLAQLSATSQPTISTGEASPWATVTAAVQSLTPVAGRRSALAFLADQTGASVCEDVAMEADDATLATLVKNIQASVAADPAPQSDPSVGWLLDHTALQLLAKVSDDSANGNKVPAELMAVLSSHTGEVGRHPSSLDEVLKGVSSRQELDNRLLAENTIFLEDSSPASRVRAYDWLNARHLAPAGYDPLGPAKARREALEKAGGG
jgi:hypothetical protein